MKTAPVKFLPGVIWIMVIFILLVMPGSDIPSNDFFEIIYFDKWVHTCLFAMLVLLWSVPLISAQKKMKTFLIIIFLAAVFYGAAMEYVQKYYAPSRSFDITDMIADTAGALIGVVVTLFIQKTMAKK